MNDALKEAAAVDPEWAKKEGRRLLILKLTVAGVLVALAVGSVSFVLGVHNSSEITEVRTRVEHSACQENAAGRECQKTKLEAERAANLQVTCAPFFKAGYPCPKPGSTAAQRQVRRQAQAGSGSAEQLDSKPASQADGTAGGVSPKGGSVKPPAPGKGGSKGEEAPTAAAEPPPTSSNPAASTETSAESTSPPPAGSSTSEEAPPGLIGNPGGVVGKAACDASEAVAVVAGVRVCSE